MDNLQIRSYRPEDENDVIQLWRQCNLVVPHNNPRRDIERKLGVNPEWFLVGLLEGRVIATCMAGYEGHRGWINYLAVSPPCQRRGVAERIMKEAEDRLKAAGCPKVNLMVRASNKGVIEFYKKTGYGAEDIVTMGKRIEPDEPHNP